ncbi:MAG: DUF1822 family protein [Rivularia sp. (in: Bacteria)]|nr:DUF1822 family protein [Rivularia sp. MS3]
MTKLSLPPEQNFSRRIQPRIAWLEAEHYEKANNISQNINDEKNQWRVYLNQLALFGFEEWLQEQIPDIEIRHDYTNFQQKSVNLRVGEFKVQLITVDSIYENFITISQENITSPQFAAHFYVLVEILEEAEQLIIHGIIRHDELSQVEKSEICKIPLSNFDSEINNLFLYIRFLEIEAIPLPKPTENITNAVTQSLVNLAQWWSGVFEESWQSLEEVLTPQTPTLGYSGAARKNTNSSDFAVRRGKLFDFGLLLNGQRFALTVNMRFEENQEIGILVQILTHNQDCLPQGLKLRVTLNHNTDEAESESAIAREYDQIIQLAFSEAVGKQFKVEAIYQDAVVIEEFVL